MQRAATAPLARSLAGSELRLPLLLCRQAHADLRAAKPKLFKYFNLKTMSVETLRDMESTLKFQATGPFDAIAIWFDTRFAYGEGSRDSGAGPDVVVLSTSPAAPETHWEQALVVLPEVVPARPGQTVPITCGLRQSLANIRHYEVSIDIGELPGV